MLKAFISTKKHKSFSVASAIVSEILFAAVPMVSAIVAAAQQGRGEAGRGISFALMSQLEKHRPCSLPTQPNSFV